MIRVPDKETPGEAMTLAILDAVAPVVDGQPTAVVVQAMAGAMLATVTVATQSTARQRAMLLRFASRLTEIAEAL